MPYAVFHARNSRMEEPLTREGKLAMRVAEKKMGLRKGIKEVARPPAPSQVANRAARSIRR